MSAVIIRLSGRFLITTTTYGPWCASYIRRIYNKISIRLYTYILACAFVDCLTECVCLSLCFFSFHYCWSLPSFVRYCFFAVRLYCVFLRVQMDEIDFLCIVCARVSVHAEVRVCMCECVFVFSP